MTSLENQLLKSLADFEPDSTSNRLTVDDAAGGWRATVQADAVDTVGCRLREVAVARLSPLENAPPVRQRAEAVAGRVTGLLEPLRLVEVDGTQDVAQLRSAAPAPKGDNLAYYEVTLHGHGGAEVARYEGSHGSKRQQVPFALTHEAIGKLVRDLTTV